MLSTRSCATGSRTRPSASAWARANASISANGRFIAFVSGAPNVVPGDTNGAEDVFVRDRSAKTTERVSVGPGGVEANSGSSVGSISADGRFVTFSSDASNLVSGDTNGEQDTFVRDRVARTTERVSVASNGAEANADSGSGKISGNGRFVAFGSNASNLVAGDTNGASTTPSSATASSTRPPVSRSPVRGRARWSTSRR